MPVQIDVLTSANNATLQFQASSIASSVTLEISGNEGVDVLTFTSGTAASAIAYAINRITDSTGVKVDLINSAAPTSGIVFKSAGYGSKTSFLFAFSPEPSNRQLSQCRRHQIPAPSMPQPLSTAHCRRRPESENEHHHADWSRVSTAFEPATAISPHRRRPSSARPAGHQ
jgi:hypothetical protein